LDPNTLVFIQLTITELDRHHVLVPLPYPRPTQELLQAGIYAAKQLGLNTRNISTETRPLDLLKTICLALGIKIRDQSLTEHLITIPASKHIRWVFSDFFSFVARYANRCEADEAERHLEHIRSVTRSALQSYALHGLCLIGTKGHRLVYVLSDTFQTEQIASTIEETHQIICTPSAMPNVPAGVVCPQEGTVFTTQIESLRSLIRSTLI
jgi:hypothetical protein